MSAQPKRAFTPRSNACSKKQKVIISNSAQAPASVQACAAIERACASFEVASAETAMYKATDGTEYIDDESVDESEQIDECEGAQTCRNDDQASENVQSDDANEIDTNICSESKTPVAQTVPVPLATSAARASSFRAVPLTAKSTALVDAIVLPSAVDAPPRATLIDAYRQRMIDRNDRWRRFRALPCDLLDQMVECWPFAVQSTFRTRIKSTMYAQMFECAASWSWLCQVRTSAREIRQQRTVLTELLLTKQNVPRHDHESAKRRIRVGLLRLVRLAQRNDMMSAEWTFTPTHNFAHPLQRSLERSIALGEQTAPSLTQLDQMLQAP